MMEWIREFIFDSMQSEEWGAGGSSSKTTRSGNSAVTPLWGPALSAEGDSWSCTGGEKMPDPDILSSSASSSWNAEKKTGSAWSVATPGRSEVFLSAIVARQDDGEGKKSGRGRWSGAWWHRRQRQRRKAGFGPRPSPRPSWWQRGTLPFRSRKRRTSSPY